ncbi:Calcium-binding protein PBP1 [Hibiscus syriacus]|uniref:Calcium-binding protein PBP1 n=1 Tax=Hibiscus syriacus TaxID=106335 RepID=A0A6A3A089_HIBSY|nr:Calcium-binding protein PBP1 [Hibiscus syriacus]
MSGSVIILSVQFEFRSFSDRVHVGFRSTISRSNLSSGKHQFRLESISDHHHLGLETVLAQIDFIAEQWVWVAGGRDKGVITFNNLKRNLTLLGLKEMCDEEAICMLREGDIDGDVALNEMEFCILMLRLNPELMNDSKKILVEAILSF